MDEMLKFVTLNVGLRKKRKKMYEKEKVFVKMTYCKTFFG